MATKYKYCLILLILIIVISGGFFGYYKYKKLSPRNANKTTQGFDTNGYEMFLDNGNKDYAAGDMGDKEKYNSAIDNFKKAISISKEKFWLPFFNLGNAYRKIGDFKNAETAYDRAIEISNFGESSLYLAKFEMYRYEIKKSEAEIMTAYSAAIEKAYENANLIVSYAAYLRDIGQNKEAIKYYEMLLEKYPDNDLYKEEIKALKKE
jgi:tetratricopeptide (TPR) repeat protein